MMAHHPAARPWRALFLLSALLTYYVIDEWTGHAA